MTNGGHPLFWPHLGNCMSHSIQKLAVERCWITLPHTWAGTAEHYASYHKMVCGPAWNTHLHLHWSQNPGELLTHKKTYCYAKDNGWNISHSMSTPLSTSKGKTTQLQMHYHDFWMTHLSELPSMQSFWLNPTLNYSRQSVKNTCLTHGALQSWMTWRAVS